MSEDGNAKKSYLFLFKWAFVLFTSENMKKWLIIKQKCFVREKGKQGVKEDMWSRGIL